MFLRYYMPSDICNRLIYPNTQPCVICHWIILLSPLSAGESASCTVIFILVYFPLMAAVVWFTLLTFSWHLTFKKLGSDDNVIHGKKGTFHLIAWCVPLVLVITSMAITQVFIKKLQYMSRWFNDFEGSLWLKSLFKNHLERFSLIFSWSTHLYQYHFLKIF